MSRWKSIMENMPPKYIPVEVQKADGSEIIDYAETHLHNGNIPHFHHYDVHLWKWTTKEELDAYNKTGIGCFEGNILSKPFRYVCKPKGENADEFTIFANILEVTDDSVVLERYQKFGKLKILASGTSMSINTFLLHYVTIHFV